MGDYSVADDAHIFLVDFPYRLCYLSILLETAIFAYGGVFANDSSGILVIISTSNAVKSARDGLDGLATVSHSYISWNSMEPLST